MGDSLVDSESRVETPSFVWSRDWVREREFS